MPKESGGEHEQPGNERLLMAARLSDRRRFLRSTLATVAAALAFDRGLLTPDAGANEAVGGPYVDVHPHLGRTWNGDPPLTAEALVRWMDENNVAKAVVLPLVSPESSSY